MMEAFHPAVQRWFNRHFSGPTAAQKAAWPAIKAGEEILLAAPTGSGKTLAAFLAFIDALIPAAIDHSLPDEVQVIYISPLKALSNDIQRNLQIPLDGITQELEEMGHTPMPIRTALRTGDTAQKDRTKILKYPPHLFVTTPESLYILLTSEGGRRLLKTAKTIIIDEIHALVENKRGSHLALSLERLDALCERRLKRVGLSATQNPIEKVAHFLVGGADPRACRILDLGHQRQSDIQIVLPASPLEAVMAAEVWDEIYQQLQGLILQHHTTLIFVNTRRMAERIAHHLRGLVGEDQVMAHHGSMSRQQRFKAEQRLKAGSLKALVATASLELGIDIGDVDLVCQIGNTRSIASFLQRVGRSGHHVGGLPKGRLFPLSRDELVQGAAMLNALRRGILDRLVIPQTPLDILAQQVIAEVAAQEWEVDALFETYKRAYPYRNLERRQFDQIIEMLSEGFSTRKGRRGAYLHHDAIGDILRPRRGARLAAITSGGAIADTASYDVVLHDTEHRVGTVHEDFAVESLPGDIFQLGTTSWQVVKVEVGRLRVQNAGGQPPTIPFWLGEAPARTAELSKAVADFRGQIGTLLQGDAEASWQALLDESQSENLSEYAPIRAAECGSEAECRGGGEGDIERERTAKKESHTENGKQIEEKLNTTGNPPPCLHRADAFLQEALGLSESARQQIIHYLAESQRVLGALPTQSTLILERFFDESGGMQLIVHSPFGARLNRAWGLALRKRFCRSFNFELQAAATEEAILLSLGHTHSFALDEVFQFLNAKTVREILIQALFDAPMFETRWRWNCARALAVLRFRAGKKIPPAMQRFMADDLISVVFPDQLACLENIAGGHREIPDHPLVAQTIKDCLEEAMDIQRLERLLTDMAVGKLEMLSRDLSEPSPLAAEIIHARPYAFLDDAPLEERRAQAVYTRRATDISNISAMGALDDDAIARVRSQAWPLIRNADELHDALYTLGFLTEAEGMGLDYFEGGDPFEIDITSPEAESQHWRHYFAELCQSGRATSLEIAENKRVWVAAERLSEWLTLHPDAQQSPALSLPKKLLKNDLDTDDARLSIIRTRMEGVGPITVATLSTLLSQEESAIEAALYRLEGEGFIFRGRYSPTATDEEWCERRLLSRIHRSTLHKLRQAIRPVSPSDFMRFLVEWQRLSPDAQALGPEGLSNILKQLEGFEAGAYAWEAHILPRRVKKYDPKWLDKLCFSGQVAWAKIKGPKTSTPKLNGRRSKGEQNRNQATEQNHPGKSSGPRGTGPVRNTPITLLQRANLSVWNIGPGDDFDLEGLHGYARRIYQVLQKRGAQFAHDLPQQTRLLPAQVKDGLAELVGWGLLTSDGYAGIRTLIMPEKKGRRSTSRRARPGFSRIMGLDSAGRWSLLEAPAPFDWEEDEADDETLDESTLTTQAYILLQRYGIVFRKVLEREKHPPPWRPLLMTLRRLEARGEIRGGRFVSGFSGEQYALPEALAQLRAVRKAEKSGELIAICGADPLNLTGIIHGAKRVPAIASNRILLKDGTYIGHYDGKISHFAPEIPVEDHRELERTLTAQKWPMRLRVWQ